ncbi:MAG TPA: hypothetical protein GXX29_10860 [Firmicutes bacterium]|nr:hypothetical protein [Bacillota bacterium]
MGAKNVDEQVLQVTKEAAVRFLLHRQGLLSSDAGPHSMSCLLAGWAGSGGAEVAENLLRNGEFAGAEQKIPPTGWTIYGQSVQTGASSITVVDADDPQKRALRIVDGVSISRGAQGEAGLYQTVNGVPGETYKASVFVKAVPDGLANGAFLQMRFLPSNQLKQVELLATSTTEFEEFAVTGVAPADTTQVRIYIWTNAPGTAKFLLQKAVLVQVKPEVEEVWTVEQVKKGIQARLGELRPGQVVPKVELYITAEDIERARRNAAEHDWARRLVDSLLREADYWAALPDEWYRNIVPPPGSLFAYGQTGCPIDGSSWPSFGGGGTADFSRPKTLRCPNGQIIKFDDPSSPYYDSGNGVVINGVRYYMRGIWNAYVTNQLAGWGNDGILQKLAYAYALTGNEKYADKAVLIMDLLATLSPTTIGPRDFATSDTQVQGRLHWLTSIVHRAKVRIMMAYDLVYHSGRMHQPSVSNPGMTNAENIEKNLIMDYLFGEFDPREGKLRSLHNHEADSVRAMLGAGIVLGNPDWIRWGAEELNYFLTNTINRDGMYYETSLSYSEFARSVFLDMIEMAYNYDPQNYATAPRTDQYPSRRDFPYELNYYDHPHIRHFVFGYREKLDAGGHLPAYGNSGMPLHQAVPGTVNLATWQAVLRFRERTALPEWKEIYEKWLVETESQVSGNQYDLWALFHAEPLPAAALLAAKGGTGQSDLFGAAALAILRSETDPTWAVEMRGGTTLPHGHDDVLGMNLYSGGYHLTWDIGYGVFGSHVHLGWGTRSIAHNLVVVNEGLNRNNQTHQVGPGASVLAFLNGKALDLVEMDAARHYLPADGLHTYRRTLLQVETPAGPYLVDLFRVGGGRTHDYSFHARSAEVEYIGLTPALHPTAWTLAGLAQPEATFDAPGRSWGERIISGEYIKNLGIPGEEIGPRGWVPPPGNGYGFIHSLRTATPADSWQATWNTDTGFKVRLTAVPKADEAQKLQVFDGLGPDLRGTTKLRFVIERKQSEGDMSLESLYTHILEAYRRDPVVREARQLPLQAGGADSVALVIDLHDDAGMRDYLFYGGPASVEEVTAGEMSFLGHNALLRETDGELKLLSLLGSHRFSALGWLVETTPSWTGRLTEVTAAGRYFQVDAALPGGTILAGLPVLIDNPAYKRNSVYLIQNTAPLAGGTRLDVGDVTFDLARAKVERALTSGLVTSKSPLPTGHAYSLSTDYLAGRQFLITRTGAAYQVDTVPAFTQIQLRSPIAANEIMLNDDFVVRDIQPGDTFLIRNVVELEQLDAATWQVRLSAPARIKPPFPVRQVTITSEKGLLELAVTDNTIELDPRQIGTGIFVMTCR